MVTVRRSHSRRFLSFGLLALILGLILLLPLPGRLLQQGLVWLGQPLHGATQFLQEHVFIYRPANELRQERDEYRKQVVLLSTRLAELQAHQDTQQAMDNLNAFLQQTKVRSLVAPIVAASPDPGIQSLVIGRGTSHGVQPGLGVISDQGIFIGKVQTVHAATATVLLVSDSRSAVAARIQNTEQSPGIIRGERGLSLRMDFIPRNHNVQSGQTVVTSGQETSIPGNLLIGSIVRTSTRAGDLFHTAVLASPLNVQAIRVVSVILP